MTHLMRWRMPANRWWLLALLGATTASVAARLVASAQRTVLLVDVIALLVGAIVVLVGLRKSPQLSAAARRWHWILIAFFVLGAIRAALWRQGSNVAMANLVVFGIGVVGATTWAIRRRRQIDQAASNHPAG